MKKILLDLGFLQENSLDFGFCKICRIFIGFGFFKKLLLDPGSSCKRIRVCFCYREIHKKGIVSNETPFVQFTPELHSKSFRSVRQFHEQFFVRKYISLPHIHIHSDVTEELTPPLITSLHIHNKKRAPENYRDKKMQHSLTFPLSVCTPPIPSSESP